MRSGSGSAGSASPVRVVTSIVCRARRWRDDKAGDKREVILGAPLLPAALAPAAHVAVLDRFWRALHREDLTAIEERLELPRDEPVVGSVVGHAEGNRLALHAPKREVHLLGLQSLQLRYHVRVKGQL